MNKKVRMHLVLPQDMARELRKTVEKRKWSDFVSEAIKEKLERMRFERVVIETAGCLNPNEKEKENDRVPS